MPRRALSLVLVAGAFVALGLPTQVASAAVGGPLVGTFTTDSLSGPATTKVVITSVTPCVDGGVGAVPTLVWTGASGGTPAVIPTTSSRTGDWTGTYDIPAAEPAGVGTFGAICSYQPAVGGPPVTTVAYQLVNWTVTGPAPTTSTSTSTTSSTSTTTSSTSTTMATTTTLAGPSLNTQGPAVEDGKVTLTTTGWMPGAVVQVTIFSDPTNLGSLVADSLGTASGSFALPANVTAGNHTVQLVGMGIAGSIQTLSVGVVVAAKVVVDTTTAITAAPAPVTATTAYVASAGTLPSTGSSPTGLAVSGALLIVAGALILARSRRQGPAVR